MGVNDLWKILKPVKKREELSTLQNKKLCVDLSIWICEAHGTKGLQQNVASPHLRNLLLRILHLTRLGVKLVFVVDGEPPELKWKIILKRIQARDRGQTQKSDSRTRVRRSHFAEWVKEVRFGLKIHVEFMLDNCYSSKGTKINLIMYTIQCSSKPFVIYLKVSVLADWLIHAIHSVIHLLVGTGSTLTSCSLFCLVFFVVFMICYKRK